MFSSHLLPMVPHELILLTTTKCVLGVAKAGHSCKDWGYCNSLQCKEHCKEQYKKVLQCDASLQGAGLSMCPYDVAACVLKATLLSAIFVIPILA
eukprot:scaffold157033_cov32-Tisochrysis_lutea.AAC.3